MVWIDVQISVKNNSNRELLPSRGAGAMPSGVAAPGEKWA
jgi:hypothetical protein